jgi:hypothetical protein
MSIYQPEHPILTQRTHRTHNQRCGRFVKPENLICPGCGEQVRPEPPGYWRVADGLPVPTFSQPRRHAGRLPGLWTIAVASHSEVIATPARASGGHRAGPARRRAARQPSKAWRTQPAAPADWSAGAAR